MHDDWPLREEPLKLIYQRAGLCQAPWIDLGGVIVSKQKIFLHVDFEI